MSMDSTLRIGFVDSGFAPHQATRVSHARRFWLQHEVLEQGEPLFDLELVRVDRAAKSGRLLAQLLFTLGHVRPLLCLLHVAIATLGDRLALILCQDQFVAGGLSSSLVSFAHSVLLSISLPV